MLFRLVQTLTISMLFTSRVIIGTRTTSAWRSSVRRTLSMGSGSLYPYTAYIALGSNLGDRCANLHAALRSLERLGSLDATSFLYESLPMYVSEQPRFLNAAVQLNTALDPEQLLPALQTIEQQVGRTKTYRNGPRVLDLDVLFCTSVNSSSLTSLVVDSPVLQIPHPRIYERAFVLQPLADLNPSLLVPSSGKAAGLKPARQLLAELPWSERNSLRRVVPLGTEKDPEGKDARTTRLVPMCGWEFNAASAEGSSSAFQRPRDCRVLVQGILNVTPDSFSDGGAYGGYVDAAVKCALDMLRAGADIIDVGGESTRPGATPVGPDEEQRRVLPVISKLVERCVAEGLPLAVSIDTRNAATAALALDAGASIVNDVTAGRHDSAMLTVAAQRQVPMVFMHSRADPQTMDSPAHTQYNNLVHDVCDELQSSLTAADRVLPRWLQVVDPGLGFAKTSEQSRLLLHPASIGMMRTRLSGRPILIGASRKRFLAPASTSLGGSAGSKTVSDLAARDDATNGANALAVLGGASIVRVHNVAAARHAVDFVHSTLSS